MLSKIFMWFWALFSLAWSAALFVGAYRFYPTDPPKAFGTGALGVIFVMWAARMVVNARNPNSLDNKLKRAVEDMRARVARVQTEGSVATVVLRGIRFLERDEDGDHYELSLQVNLPGERPFHHVYRFEPSADDKPLLHLETSLPARVDPTDRTYVLVQWSDGVFR